MTVPVLRFRPGAWPPGNQQQQQQPEERGPQVTAGGCSGGGAAPAAAVSIAAATRSEPRSATFRPPRAPTPVGEHPLPTPPLRATRPPSAPSAPSAPSGSSRRGSGSRRSRTQSTVSSVDAPRRVCGGPQRRHRPAAPPTAAAAPPRRSRQSQGQRSAPAAATGAVRQRAAANRSATPCGRGAQRNAASPTPQRSRRGASARSCSAPGAARLATPGSALQLPSRGATPARGLRSASPLPAPSRPQSPVPGATDLVASHIDRRLPQQRRVRRPACDGPLTVAQRNVWERRSVRAAAGGATKRQSPRLLQVLLTPPQNTATVGWNPDSPFHSHFWRGRSEARAAGRSSEGLQQGNLPTPASGARARCLSAGSDNPFLPAGQSNWYRAASQPSLSAGHSCVHHTASAASSPHPRSTGSDAGPYADAMALFLSVSRRLNDAENG
eukprot:TRINITY_DN13097_c0_g1_i2.p1 TRINITY_DN13097_c0_g1~~TRINITY_DN13097_c0_g1_i2.p1  ORF type:complete len:475 (+),score=56.88 TRINITY_DN13097_c0_g1_i2:106-1425(+)